LGLKIIFRRKVGRGDHGTCFLGFRRGLIGREVGPWVDNVVPTLAPQSRAPDVQIITEETAASQPAQQQTKKRSSTRIAQSATDEETSFRQLHRGTRSSRPLSGFGILIAIVVALALVWVSHKRAAEGAASLKKE